MKRAVILAPGAGTSVTHEWMNAQTAALNAHGLVIFRFDFVYRAAGRNAPDRLPKLVAAYEAVVARVMAGGWTAKQIWLGGKSMGGRVASHVVAGGACCRGLVFYGYPIAPNGVYKEERTAHWPDIDVPGLFLTGSKDRLCPLQVLERQQPQWGAPTTNHVIDDADHSFRVPKRAARSADEIHSELAGVVAGWMRGTRSQ